MRLGKTFGIAAVALAAFGLGTAYASPITYKYTFTGSNGAGAYTAQATLHTDGGQALSGSGTITGGGLTGVQSLTLVTLSTPGVEDDGGGLLGYRSNDGADWFNAGTAIPIDADGLIFAMGPIAFGGTQQFDVFSDGSGGFDSAFFGKANPGVAPSFYEYGAPVSVSFTAVPEPASWTLLLSALFGIGLMVHLSRRKVAVSAA